MSIAAADDVPRSFAADAAWTDALAHALADGFCLRSDAPSGVILPTVPEHTPDAMFRARSVDLLDLSVPSHTLPEPASVIIDRILATSGEAVLFVPKVRRRSLLLSALEESGTVPYALADAGSSAFCDVRTPDALKALSRENLRNVDRLRRRAEREHGDVVVETVTASPCVCTDAFDRMVAIEDAGWKGTGGAGTSLAADTRAQGFFRDVMRRFGDVARARIDFLTIGGRDAAAQLMVRAGHTWFLLKIGYHPDFRQVGPGGILLKALLDEMVTTPGIHEVNLTTNPPWAARWHFQTEPVFHVSLYNTTLEGRLRYAGRSIKELAKALRDRQQAIVSSPPSAPTS